jgi:hypothetical protein
LIEGDKALKNIHKFIRLILQVQKDKHDSKDALNFLNHKGFTNEEITDNLKTIISIKKKDLLKMQSTLQNEDSSNKSEKLEEKVALYIVEEIFKIFEKDEVQIKKQFNVNDLKNMYRSIYKQEPRNSMKKDDLINSIKNRIRIISRANSFKQ